MPITVTSDEMINLTQYNWKIYYLIYFFITGLAYVLYIIISQFLIKSLDYYLYYYFSISYKKFILYYSLIMYKIMKKVIIAENCAWNNILVV